MCGKLLNYVRAHVLCPLLEHSPILNPYGFPHRRKSQSLFYSNDSTSYDLKPTFTSRKKKRDFVCPTLDRSNIYAKYFLGQDMEKIFGRS